MPPWPSSTRSRSRSSPTMSATPMSARRRSPCRNSPTSCWPAPRRSPARRCWRPISATGCACARASAGREHIALFDTGTEGAIFIRNCRNLGLDLGEVEEIAITHGHWDHMGALPAAIDAIVGRRGRGSVTVHVNPGMFNERGVLLKSGVVFPAAKVPTPAEMEARGARVVNDGNERLLLDGHFYYSGEIPRVSAFETGRAGPSLPARQLRGVAARSLPDGRAHAGGQRARSRPGRVQRLQPRRHRQCLHRGPAPVPRHPDPRRDGRPASGRRHGASHPADGRGARSLRHPATSSPATAPAGAHCTPWPPPTASGSASRPSAPATCSTAARRQPRA